MKSWVAGLVASGIVIVPTGANAIEVQASTGNYVTARDCSGPAGAVCSSLGSIVFSEYGGAPGALSATASITSAEFGTASSDTALSGEIGAPILRTYASSEAGERVNTNSFALQRYTYTGTEATTRTFGGVLDYSQTITDPNNSAYGIRASGVNVGIVVFTTSDAFVEAGTTAESNYNNIMNFAFGAASGYSLLGEDWYNDLSDAAVGSATLGVSLDLNPGESVWVWAFLQTPAADGSVVDASHTFVTRWDNAVGLVPAASTSVPEPGPLALFGLGLAGLVVRRRRDAA